MKRYTLNRLYLENFKLIPSNKPKLIDFSHSAENLIVLSGPNGFGKTTIFDALEIVFTNNISRIQNINHGGTKRIDNLLSKDKYKDVIIKAEFKIDDSYLTIVKRIPHDSKNNNEINLKNIIETYFFDDKLELANDFGVPIYNQDFSNEISNRLGIDSNNFNIFNYISQEETTHYLKRGERNRQGVLDELFDIKYLTERVDNFKKMKKFIENKEKSLKEKVANYYKYMSAKNDIYDTRLKEYVELILYKDKEIYWDTNNPEIKSKDEIGIIDQLEKFIEYYDEFKKDLFNHEIDVYINDESLINNFIYLKAINYIDSFHDINIANKEYDILLEFYNSINEENIIESFNKQNFLTISNDLNLDINIEFISEKIKIINSYKELQSENNKILNNFNNLRKQLKEEFENLKTNEIESNKCPLCNSTFKSTIELIKSINIKTDIIEELLDNSTDKLNKETQQLYIYIEPFRKIIKEKIDGLKNRTIDNELFNNIKIAFKNKENVKKLHDFLNKNDIINTIMKEIDENNMNYSHKVIIEALEGLCIPLSSDYKFYKNKYNFKDIYSDILFEKKCNIDYILSNKELLDNKRQYLQSSYLTYKKNEEIKLKEEFIGLKSELINIRKLKNSVINIYTLYSTKINNFKFNLIPDIEIPLYIYTGKIIQNYQRGLGVFIDDVNNDGKLVEEGELKRIKFVPDMETKHDIINSFSSGQLSGFVIAFTMVMNKIYSKDDLNMILIDDPVQTMDEINISSLVEVLRNEFADTQIILSTHDSKISNYIRYKFSKYDIQNLDYNVKDNLKL